MKALLTETGNELKEIFKLLTTQVNAAQPENLSQKKSKWVFENELFYEIKPSERVPNWVEVTATFKESGAGYTEMDITLPGRFFINYENLSKDNLSIFEKSDLLKIQKHAENKEDFGLCSDIQSTLKDIENYT